LRRRHAIGPEIHEQHTTHAADRSHGPLRLQAARRTRRPAPPDAIVVAPATFNTINKWAYGISDTLALGLLNEAIGLGLPIVAVPNPSTALAKHPAFLEGVTRLRSWGVTVLFDPDVYPLPTPNMGPAAAKLFPWPTLTAMTIDIMARSGQRG
jgi:hypothetical protein